MFQANVIHKQTRDQHGCVTNIPAVVAGSLSALLERDCSAQQKGRGIRGLSDASMMQRVSAIPPW
jgi:hypothetical protein